MSSKRLQQLEALLESSPTDSFLLFAIAKEQEKLEEEVKALSYYNKLLQLDPQYVGTYYHLAKLYEKRGQFTEALEIYEKGMQIARQLGDQHALAELSSAKMNLELEL
ncbi:MAG: tetratricopeptide repeat protein [Saprospiraceae bacterium]